MIENIKYGLEKIDEKDEIFKIINFNFINENIDNILKEGINLKTINFIDFITTKNNQLKQKIKERQISLLLNDFNYDFEESYESLFLSDSSFFTNVEDHKKTIKEKIFKNINNIPNNLLKSFLKDYYDSNVNLFKKNLLKEYEKEENKIKKLVYKNLTELYIQKKFELKKENKFSFFNSFEFKVLSCFKNELTEEEFKKYFSLFYFDFFLKIKNISQKIMCKENIESDFKIEDFLLFFFEENEIEVFLKLNNENIMFVAGFENVLNTFQRLQSNKIINEIFYSYLVKTEDGLKSLNILEHLDNLSLLVEDFINSSKEEIESYFYNKNFILKKKCFIQLKKIEKANIFNKEVKEKIQRKNKKIYYDQFLIKEVAKIIALKKIIDNYYEEDLQGTLITTSKKELNLLFLIENINLELFKIGLNLNIDFLYKDSSIINFSFKEVLKVFERKFKNSFYFQELGNETEKNVCKVVSNSVLIKDFKLQKGGGIKSDIAILENGKYKGVSVKSSVKNNFYQINLGCLVWKTFIKKLKENKIDYISQEKKLRAFFNPIQAIEDGIINKNNVDFNSKKLKLDKEFESLKNFFNKNFFKIFEFFISDKELETKYLMLIDNSNKNINNIKTYLIEDILNFVNNNCFVIYENNIVYLVNKKNNDKIARLCIYAKSSRLEKVRKKEDVLLYYKKKEGLKVVLYNNIFKYIKQNKNIKATDLKQNKIITEKAYQEILNFNKK